MKLGITLHDKVRKNAVARGADGSRWITNLPNLIARLEDEWSIEIGSSYPNATEAYVAEARTADGEEVVLKIPFLPDAATRERRMLRAVDGRGYVRLLRSDPASSAMLLERLGPQLAQLDLPINRQIEAIVETLQIAWMPLPHDMSVVTGREKASEMAAYIQSICSKLDQPCSNQAISTALRFAAARRDAFDPATAVLAHGDAHCWNTLSDPKSGTFKFVDPDGLFIERGHDLSISMREWSAELLVGDPVTLGRQRCELLADLAGVHPRPIWQWGFVERLVNGLLYLERGSPETASEFLEVVEAWAQAEPD